MGNPRKRIAQAVVLGTLGLSTVALAAPKAAASKVSEGKYLLEEVGKCQDCHTPMTANGPDRTKWLKGAALPFQPMQPIPGWAKMAPDLTPSGVVFKSWGEKGLRDFLMKGVDAAGHPANPPMPGYRMRQEHAEAIVEYLKTLK